MISTDTSANVIHGPARGAQAPTSGWWRDPRGAALGCLAAYLAVSAVALATGGHWWLVAAHAAGLEAIRRTIAPRGTVAVLVGDLLPLVVAPVLYGEIPMLIAATGASYHDLAVQRWELALWGTQPSQVLAGALPFTWLSETLHAGYLAYYVVIFVPPMVLLFRGERRGVGQTVLALTITYAVCWTAFALFPVEGPRYLWTAPTGIPDGPVRRAALRLLASGSARGAAFPSSHMAIAVVQTLMAWRWQRAAAWPLAIVAVAIGVGAVYAGFHYAVDMLAGTGLAVAVVVGVSRFSNTRPLGAE